MSILRISLFGKFQAQRGEQVLVDFNAGKVQELFCYILLYRDRPHSREALASLMWDEYSTRESRRHLRQALWQLQNTLSCNTELTNPCLLVIKPDWVQLNPNVHLWLDVAVFEEAFALCRTRRGRELDLQCFEALQGAVGLYRGDLLEGCYYDWCLYERERFQNMYLTMLDKLAGYCETHYDYETGIDYAIGILRWDRAHERAHQRLMRLRYLTGDRTGALRQYECCTVALAEELGVKPAQRTVNLYKQIQEDQLHDLVSTVTKINGRLEATTPPLPKILGHLIYLKTSLVDIQHQVEQEIERVEHILVS
jgi:DNA-binding SARP family transcriptional activator